MGRRVALVFYSRPTLCFGLCENIEICVNYMFICKFSAINVRKSIIFFLYFLYF